MWLIPNILIFLIIFPIISCLFLLIIPNSRSRLIQNITLNVTLVNFLTSLILWILFDYSTSKFQFVYNLNQNPFLAYLNCSFVFGIDGISLFFILLTTFLIPICLLVSWVSMNQYIREYCICLLVLESLLIAVFSTLDLLLFYVFFEGVVIPMYIMIGVWGSRQRKIQAAYQFFLYTIGGSILMLLGILCIYIQVGTTDLSILFTTEISERRQILLWLSFFASFAVKIPMVPVHIWLPEAHVEAPTAGSLILAGLLLKLGTYGFLRFSIPLFPYASVYLTPLVLAISLIGVIYTSLTTIRQIDLKKIIAYSSVAHMNVVTIGLFCLNAQGIEGSLFLMLAHGVVSPALFLCVDVLYSRYKTRSMKYYGGCAQTMPLFSFFFLAFTMANIALPSSANFVGEFLIFQGTFLSHTVTCILAATSMVLSGCYALWACNRVLFGNLKPSYISEYSDLSRREFYMLLICFILTLLLGCSANIFIDVMRPSIANLLAFYSYF
uniref:NADH-ubiquinone oxidoreductase chain 4 n=1 Tax=Symbiochloris sp. SG-2018 TaxID=2126034 RepID=A0A976U7T5_9CHLO|nr:NADH dehydrogenase subunit 4 [Symbiochloris sp. SG-2018]UVF37878.1 NADH dehydrogenase subunit 4 [Symbiochloris sp. SG-2018]